MTDETRRLKLAREAWQSMRPSDAEVTWAARRLATRFSPRKTPSLGRHIRMVSGALATIAGIAYASSGQLSDLDFAHWRAALSTPQIADEVTPPFQSRSTDALEPIPRAAPRSIAIDALPVPPAVEAPAKIKKKALRAASTRSRHSGALEGGTINGSSVASESALADNEKLDASWSGVNAALASLDYKRAESLLLQLSDGSHDADTRAKAHLGLAQLAAARNNCERARVLALGVAAAPGIEMKTVRRALELAVSCAR